MLIGEGSEPESASDPWTLYLYAIKSPATKEKYLLRLKKFLGFLYLEKEEDGKLEDKARAFVKKEKDDNVWAFNSILRFILFQKERVSRKEITVGTIRNYVKSIKLFCHMSDIDINWEKITRGLPKGKRYVDDIAPTLVEVKKLCEYPDRRIKSIVYTMISSGIHVGAWDNKTSGYMDRDTSAFPIRDTSLFHLRIKNLFQFFPKHPNYILSLLFDHPLFLAMLLNRVT